MRTLIIVLGIIAFVGCMIAGCVNFYRVSHTPGEGKAKVTIPLILGFVVIVLCYGSAAGIDYIGSYGDAETQKINSIKQTDKSYVLYLSNGKSMTISKKNNNIAVADNDYVVASWNKYGSYKDETVYMTQATIDGLSNVEAENVTSTGIYISGTVISLLTLVILIMVIKRMSF